MYDLYFKHPNVWLRLWFLTISTFYIIIIIENDKYVLFNQTLHTTIITEKNYIVFFINFFIFRYLPPMYNHINYNISMYFRILTINYNMIQIPMHYVFLYSTIDKL